MASVRFAAVFLLAATAYAAPAEAVRLNEAGIRKLIDRESDGAVEAFRGALGRAPDSRAVARNLAAALVARAEDLRTRRKQVEALPLLDEAVRLHPERLRYRVLRGRARYETEMDRRLAAEDFDHVLQRDPDYLDALVNAGQLLYLERQLQRAVDHWRHALRLRPGDADVQRRLARAEKELDVERGFEELHAGAFIVRYSPKIPLELAQGVLVTFEAADSVLRNRFQSFPAGQTAVTLYAPSEFRAATGAHAWVAGLSDGTIRLTVRPADSPIRLKPTIYHEYTHHLVRIKAPRAPEWLHEGLAQRSEDRSRSAAEARLRAAPDLEPSALSERMIRQRDPRRVSLLYDLALSFTHFLYEDSGEARIHDLLSQLKSDGNELVALRRVYGRSRDELFEAWRRRLRGE
jgi:tetratricopeptide (TPR) repeat protein